MTKPKKKPAKKPANMAEKKHRAGVCRICDCTDEWGCENGCSWVRPDLCSTCSEMLELLENYRNDAFHFHPGRLLREIKEMALSL